VTVNVRPPEPKVTVRPPAPANGDEEPKVTVRVKAPEPAAPADKDETKVTIKVRRPDTDKDSAAPAAAPTISAGDTKVTVKVKAPVKEQVPDDARRAYEDTLDEPTRKLQEGVRMADLGMMLDALKAGADPNVVDDKGRPPLHYAAGLGLAPSVVLLVHYGAVLDARDPGGLTPLILASGYVKPQTLRVLIAAGADPTLEAPGQGTAKDVIEALGDNEIAKLVEKNRFQQKEGKDKLQNLKKCMDVLLDPEEVRKEANWDEMLSEVLQLIPKDPPQGAEDRLGSTEDNSTEGSS